MSSALSSPPRASSSNNSASKSVDIQRPPATKNPARRSSGKDEGGSSSPTGSSSNVQDGDLFSFLSAMHLSNGNGLSALPAQLVQQATNRKRKFLEQGGGLTGAGANSKLNGLRGPPFMRRGSDDDEEHALHTPQCSQSGYADDEDRHEHEELRHGSSGGSGRRGGSGSVVSPVNMSEIDLAANFDDSLSGLGVDINAANYMSEALLALPNLSISSSHIFKQEVTSPSGGGGGGGHHHHHRYKDEPLSRADSGNENPTPPGQSQQNYGALDLSNDEAHLPDSNGNDSDGQVVVGPRTFIGSVSRDSSRGGTPLMVQKGDSMEEHSSFGSDYNPKSCHSSSVNGDIAASISFKSKVSSLPDVRTGNLDRPLSGSLPGKMLLPLPPSGLLGGAGQSSQMNSPSSSKPVHITKVDMDDPTIGGDRFQYILHASTSLATKINDPTITYLNQGQSYELRLKKLGDLSSFRKKYLRCTIRICFHERRLRYMENEQIAEWRNSHPGERILYVDLPLSYGIMDVCQDPMQLNVVSFKWDPTRDTGIFIKVNCISTEFTPKKHGGEKGVPFRLQVETFDYCEDVRLHAAGCILQVFKLKGADRKHKQDRDKISKRPSTEQEKFAPSYDCTVLSDLSIDNIYVPPTSRPTTPIHEDSPVLQQQACAAMAMPSSRDDSPGISSKILMEKEVAPNMLSSFATQSSVAGPKYSLPITASVEAVTQWLSKNRYGSFISSFRNFNGRDMLRLLRDEIITLCGLSDGIRLYNDLHMVVVAPRTTFYVGQKDTHEYTALFLEETTVQEFVLRLAASIGVDTSVFARIFIVGPHNILLRMTDAVVMYTKPETVFQFSLRQNDQLDSCDVILENVSPMLEMQGGGMGGVDGSGGGGGVVLSDMHPGADDHHKDSE